MKYFFIVSVLFLAMPISAQTQENEVLMTVDGAPVYASEFKRVYGKNLDLVVESGQEDIDSYLQLFKNYKLKLAAAEELGLLEREDLKKELEGYKNQLAENLMMDSPVTESLVEEAYDHMLHEVQASHIMVAVSPSSKPKDTLIAYNKIREIRQKLVNGAAFETVAREKSEDPSVVNNGGDLGWFSAFKMVYPFEKAAYETPVVELSPIVRSSFGYHILKTTDKRESRGEVEVAHIMLALNRKEGGNDQERRIWEIYKKLQNGESFDLLARKYSEDTKTARQGGNLARFAAGELNSTVFEDKAFALENTGDFSEPFKTKMGWHIVKLNEKFPIEPLADLRPLIESKIKSDSRSQLLESALIEKLEKELNLWENDEVLAQLGESFSATENQKDTTVLLAVKEDSVSVSEFADFIAGERRFAPVQKTDTLELKSAYRRFKSKKLREFYKEHLAETNAEFAQITKEYREGILLFALMEEKIWNPAKEDSVGLAAYFEKHHEEYMNPPAYDVLVVNGTELSSVKKARKLLKKGKEYQVVQDSLNKNEEVHIFLTQATASAGNALFPEDYTFKSGVSRIYKGDTDFTVVDLKKTIPAEQKSLDDVRGEVIGDYQQYLEEEWIKTLSEEHEVEMNTAVFESVKKELSR
ncbi:peptidylprolyl isomerase [Flavimarina sp. Hel_I_48]|uniref:peptidylprolyl isomerase n=1 Tax=Flavimarina sp. Hel_I_48 TaxID=1392488 RepID=UPI00056968EF|nr:peptidylprolyl isomerase [Flavimarina sp. Hel_I_48]